MATLAEAVGAVAAPAAPKPVPPAVAMSPEMVRAATLDRIRTTFAKFGPWTSQRGERVQDMPANYVKGVLGLGPAATALAGAAAREAPKFAAAVMGDQAAKISFGGDVVEMSKALGEQAVEAVKHPVRSIIQQPFELTPVVGGALKAAAGVAVKAGEVSGTALGRAVASVAKPVAEVGPYRAGAAAAVGGMKSLPVVGPTLDRLWKAHEAFGQADKIISDAGASTHIERNLAYKQFVKDYGGLSEPDRADWMQVMAGRLPPERATAAAQAAVESWKGLPAQVQSEWIGLGKLTPEAAYRRAHQPARIEALQKAVSGAMSGTPDTGAVGKEVADYVGTKGGQARLWREVRSALPDEPPADWLKANAEAIGRQRTRTPKDLWEAEVRARFNENPVAVASEHLTDAAGHRRIAGHIEARLQTLAEKPPQGRQPSLEQMAPEAKSRRPWQMTRQEWEALPEPVRAKKAGAFGNAAATAEDPYAYSVERAIRARWAVPREVLAQNPDWQVMARTPAIQRIHALTEEVAAELARQGNQAPMYFPHINDPAVNPAALRSGLSVGRRYRPTTLKNSKGRLYTSGELTNRPELMAAKVVNELLRYKQANAIIDGIIKMPSSRVMKGIEDLGPNEVAFSPDGLRLWSSQISFGNKLSGLIRQYGTSAEGVESALSVAVRTGISEGDFVATAAGFRKPVVYAIDKMVAFRINLAADLSPASLKPFLRVYDAPTALWRLSVLALRPAWVFNNIIGNTVFSTMNGLAPRHYLMALKDEYLAKTPDNLNGVHLTSNAETELANLGRGEQGNVQKFMDWLDTRPAPVNLGDLFRGPKEAGGAGLRALDPRRYAQAVTDFNREVESFYRRANFWKDVEAKGRAVYLKRTGDRFYRAFDALDELDNLGPEGVEAAIKRTNDFMADYGALNPLEREVVRRAVPFYNFLKHQVRFVGGLPMDYPGRFTLLQGAMALGRDAQSYDNAMLPAGLQDKGLTFTGYYVEVEGRKKAVFVSTSGANPLTVGFSPTAGMAGEAGASDILPMLAASTYQSANPLLKYPIGIIRPGYNVLTGAPLTAPGKYEEGGKFYDSKDFTKEVPPPSPSLPEYYAGSFPQVQLARHLINPRADFTGSPLSLQSSRENSNRTAVTELLKYFSPINLVLVDQTNLGEPPIQGLQLRRMLKKAIRSGSLVESDAKQPAGVGH